MDVYAGKTVLAKDPKSRINHSQGDFRAPLFLAMIGGKAKSIAAADGRSFRFGGTTIEFSDAVYHGANSALGYVIQTMVSVGEMRFVHTSDVQGMPRQDQAEFILRNRPQTAVIDGPMVYMLGHACSQEEVNASMANLRAIAAGGTKSIILDHHFVRDTAFTKYLDQLRGECPGTEIGTAAEMIGLKDDLLEARRKELYGGRL